LRDCLDLLESLGYCQFLSVDGPRNREFLVQAAARGVGEAFIGRLLERLGRAVQPAAQPSPLLVAAEPSPTLTVQSLGRFEVTLNGRAVGPREWGTQAARELFLYLLIHDGRASKEQLMAALAPDASPARANSQFHVAAYRVRRALYRGCVRFDGDTYQLDPAVNLTFDVALFRQAVAAADHAEMGSAAELKALRQAVAGYTGRFLEGSYAEWVLAEQRRLEDEFLHAASCLASAELERGDQQAAIDAATRGLAVDNSLQELHEVVVRALVQQGRRADADRHLEAYAAYLREELGADLPRELRHLLTGQTRPRLLVSH
jgi:DNA-binding SARP family transcriptional activator